VVTISTNLIEPYPPR